MKNKRIIKFYAILLVFILIFEYISPNIIYAKTSTYSSGEYDVTSESEKEKEGLFKGLIMSALGGFVFGCGFALEKLGAWIIGMFSEIKKFPWSDAIIFNSIPLLDVNFINPAENSLFLDGSGNYTTIGNSLRNVYFSGLSIGLGFFGIIVAVMAIRLAISSIASEKAKYKEAIVQWITALVLLFALHYILSFVFYLNEQLVEVASKIVNTTITNGGTTAKTVSGLGEYFRDSVSGEWGTSMFVSAIIYSVFVIQSLMFFFAYIKRLFFVVILAVISPFTVIYDFMKKAIS